MSLDLSISRIYGTSSSGALTVAITKNLVAYIASGGVVVCNITTDEENNVKLTNQRFFCATQTKSQQSKSYINSTPDVVSKDLYGIPRPSTPVLIKENTSSSDLLTASPPKGSPQQAYTGNSQPLKLKTISAIAISPDEKLLALGETGNQPRIHIFSLAPDSNNTPIVTILEHSFGIHALKFSPNSQNLLSLGLPHDGFIYVWKINGLLVDCIAVNKCTTVVSGIDWINDEDLVTYGVRHVKFWRLEESGKRPRETLQGKNVILGDFINCNFVYLNVVHFGEDQVLLFLLTATGEMCWYNPEENTLKLKYKFQEGKKIGSILVSYDQEKLWYGDDDGSIQSISIETIDQFDEQQPPFDGNIDSPSKVKFSPSVPFLQRLEGNDDGIFYITNNEEIKYFNTKSEKSINSIDSLSKLSTGLKLTSNGQIVNWTRNGLIQKINRESFDIEYITEVQLVDVSNKVIENHITALDISSDEEILVGDAYGNLTIYSITGELIQTFQAHEFSVNDVTYFEIDNVKFLVSIGRDRMIQVFSKSSGNYVQDVSSDWSLLQTIDCHKGNLLKLVFAGKNRIYTSSADRSIVVHEINIDEGKVVINKLKTISLKSTPSTLFIHENELFISTSDKQISIYDTANLDLTKTFKLHDAEMESLLVDNISITSQGYLLCSCSDKTVRVFNHNTMKQLAANWGHSEPIKSLVLSDAYVVTLSNNGCLFKWTLSADSSPSTIQRYSEITPKVVRKIKTNSTPTSSPQPVRRVHTMSPNRSPTALSKFQSTPRLTPSKLSNTAKTNLSPSPSLKANTPGARRLSPAAKITPASSPTARSYNPKLSALKPSSLNSPTINARSVLGSRPFPNVNANETQNEKENDENKEGKENKVNVDELLYMIKKFKEDIGDYSYSEVSLVKKELQGLFDIENDLIKKYTELIVQTVKSNQ